MTQTALILHAGIATAYARSSNDERALDELEQFADLAEAHAQAGYPLCGTTSNPLFPTVLSPEKESGATAQLLTPAMRAKGIAALVTEQPAFEHLRDCERYRAALNRIEMTTTTTNAAE